MAVESALADLAAGPPVLVTGAAGFIGYHMAIRLLDAGASVIGLDNINDYYDTRLKRARIAQLQRRPRFNFIFADIANSTDVANVFETFSPQYVVHLGAQAGVRYSITHPEAYISSNVTGFLSVLEACRKKPVAHLLYASSSSVYGGNRKLPFSVVDGVDHPVSLYAATKKFNELMAHTYAHLYGVASTGLRFFTVYGPWGRPDMAYWKFTESIMEDKSIDIFNYGKMARDFTYIDDVIDAIIMLVVRPAIGDKNFDPAAPDPATSWAPYRVYNIGATTPEPLLDMVRLIEQSVGRVARKRLLPMQPGDVLETWADCSGLEATIGWRPVTPLAVGLPRFVEWLREWRNGRYS